METTLKDKFAKQTLKRFFKEKGLKTNACKGYGYKFDKNGCVLITDQYGNTWSQTCLTRSDSSGTYVIGFRFEREV